MLAETTAGTSKLIPPIPAPPERELTSLSFIALMRTNAIACWPAAAYEKPALRRRILGRTRITVSDPDAVRRVLIDESDAYGRTPITKRLLRPILGDGLLISEGMEWRHQRRTLAPAFTPRAVDLLVPHILSATDDAIERLCSAARQGPVDLFEALHRLALEIAGRTMFSVGMDRHGPPLRDFVQAYSESMGRPRVLDILLPLSIPAPNDFARRRFRRRWTIFLDEVIAKRSAEDRVAANDLLDLLNEARDAETGQAFTPEALRDQVATLMLAGHETTALTLLWACVLLALAPDIQQRVHEEVAADPGGARNAAALPYTRAVIDETLRLYPAAFMITRIARRADTLAGEDVRPGDIVAVSPWLLHRHRRLWQEPDAFDPDRFRPGAPPIPRLAYLPFGAGPRVCIGASFALTESVLSLARIVRTFRIELAQTRPVLPAAVVTTQPDHAPAFRLTARSGG